MEVADSNPGQSAGILDPPPLLSGIDMFGAVSFGNLGQGATSMT
jgi:hypothetical protein